MFSHQVRRPQARGDRGSAQEPSRNHLEQVLENLFFLIGHRVYL